MIFALCSAQVLFVLILSRFRFSEPHVMLAVFSNALMCHLIKGFSEESWMFYLGKFCIVIVIVRSNSNMIWSHLQEDLLIS